MRQIDLKVDLRLRIGKVENGNCVAMKLGRIMTGEEYSRIATASDNFIRVFGNNSIWENR